MWLSVFIAVLCVLIPSVYTQGITTSRFGPLQPPDCGLSNVTFRRIVGGQLATLGAWPWMTALGYTSQNPARPNWWCGGSLISEQHVLTAAHCLVVGLYLVRIGDLHLTSDYDGARPFQDYIKSMATHPYYDQTSLTNDIAVLKTTRPVPFTSVLHPICLPVDARNRYRNLDNLNATVAGWGRVVFQGIPSNRLLQVQVPITTEQNCKQAYPEGVIDQRVVCAGYAGRSTCQYDSGGPLMIPSVDYQRVYYVFGVVSSAYRCAEPYHPTVYTRVTSFLDFITRLLI